MKNSAATALVVGGGIIGSMHALAACEAGYQVIHLERDKKPQSASVRNFGLIWVSGRAAGTELDLALRARTLWGEIGAKAQVGFRANGSLTIAQSEIEYALIEAAVNLPDAGARGFSLLTRELTETIEPALRGKYLGALRCSTDATVEPNLVLSGIRGYLMSFSGYQWLPEAEIMSVKHDQHGNHVTDLTGRTFSGDYLAICPGAWHQGFVADYLDQAPLRKVRLQMAATAPLAETLSHSLADIDSLRYYPAFKDLPLSTLPAQNEIAAKYKMQLLLVQRLDGSLTIGDTHEYEEPFSHELLEAPYDHLSTVISNIFGAPAPRIERRWDGVYSQSTLEAAYLRREIAPGAVIVTGVGGRGNTLSPAIAEETVTSWIQ